MGLSEKKCLDCDEKIPWSDIRCASCFELLTLSTIERTINPETVEEEEISWTIWISGLRVGEIKTTPDMLEEIVRKHLITLHHYNHNITVQREA